MFRRLNAQILLLLSLVLSVMIALFGWWVGGRQVEIYINTLTENIRVLGRINADNAAHQLIVQNYAELEQNMLATALMPGIAGIQVMEDDGSILCDIERKMAQGNPAVFYKRAKGKIPDGTEQFIQREGVELVCWTPILAGKPLGWVKINYTLLAAEEIRRSIWRNTLMVGLISIIIGIALMALVLKRPLSAIGELSLFALDLNSKKGEKVDVWRGAIEIETLADSLNHASLEISSAEQQLVAERERLAFIIRSIGDGVLACDPQGQILLMNRAAEVLTGYSMEESAGRAYHEVFRLIDEITGEPFPPLLKRISDPEREEGIVESAVLVSRDGKRHNIVESDAPIINTSGDKIGVVIVFRDETEKYIEEQKRSNLEDQLRHSQKMEAVGRLAGGVAHDFNNILTAVIGYASFLSEYPGLDATSRSFAEKILNAADRAKGLTAGLLAFSRKQKVELKNIDLNEVVRKLESMMRRVIGEDVQMNCVLAPRQMLINADPSQIEQVILNLATNSRDAMEIGGLLSITTQIAELDGTSIDNNGPLNEKGRFALLCVSDSGTGMDELTLQNMFEPFYTTKEVGKGTGLGLAIVQGVVQQHNGFVRVYSNEGVGTTFKIYLPLLDDGATSAAESVSGPLAGGTERILLVEDEPEIRQVARMMLEKGGYSVIEAGDGIEAFEILQQGADIQLVISDVIMPRLTGKKLHEKVRESFPAMKFMFISGYTFDVMQYKGIVEGDVELLMKPFTNQELLSLVRMVLDGSVQ